MLTYPFNLYAGLNAGISNFSQSKLNAIQQSEPLGQAKLAIYTNGATGGIHVKDIL